MKKITLFLLIVTAFSAIGVLAKTRLSYGEISVNSAIGGNVKIVNDTDADVQIHTGSGFVEINKTSSTSVSCEAGKEIRLANKGKKGDVLFVIEDSMCGKVVKLSKYL